MSDPDAPRPQRITAARITTLPIAITDPLPEVWVTYDDGGPEELLFTYYSDELTFTPEEFVGLTQAEGLCLLHQRDVAYLQDPPEPGDDVIFPFFDSP